MTLTTTDINVDELLKEIFDETHLCQIRIKDTEDSEYCLVEADWQWLFEWVCEHAPMSYYLCDPHHRQMSKVFKAWGLQCRTCQAKVTVKEMRPL